MVGWLAGWLAGTLVRAFVRLGVCACVRMCVGVCLVCACRRRHVLVCLLLGTRDCASSPPLRCRSAIYPSLRETMHTVPLLLSPLDVDRKGSRDSSPPAVVTVVQTDTLRAVGTRPSVATCVRGAIGRTSWPE